MTRLIVFLAATLVSGAAQANCQWIDRPTADRALSILRDTPTAVLGDRVGQEPVPRIGLVGAPSYMESWDGGPWYGLVAHGGREINIEQVYFQSADGSFVNLGLQLGCAGDTTPERLPDTAPLREADRSGAPVPDGSGPRFIGLVDLRSLYSNPEATREPVPVHPVTLYGAPDLSASAHATIPDWDALPNDHMGYDFPAALVLERDRGWYRIGVIDGPMPPDMRWALGWYRFSSSATAWVAPEDAGEFRSYEDLVTNNLAYLGGRWDGLLSAEPDPAARVWSLAPEWRSGVFWAQYGVVKPVETTDVEVLETRWVGGRLWVRVAVKWPVECEVFVPLVIAEGWVPGHAEDGGPVVRYYSGGC